MESSRKALYAQRARRYLDLYSSIATHNSAEKALVRLTALQCVLDDKLKQLVEDPRALEDIIHEITQTENELLQINKDINKLLHSKKEEEKTRRALYELLKAKSIADTAQSDYIYSRIGKIMGIQYTISQIIIMAFLGVLLFATFGTGSVALGLIIPLMVCGVPSTGVSNWWLFRGLVAKTLIILRNMFGISTDVALTNKQIIKLGFASVACVVTGFIAAYSCYILVVGLMPAALELLGTAAFFAGVGAGAPWLVPLLLTFFVLTILVGSGFAVAAYFYKVFYEPSLNGSVWQDIKLFFRVLFIDNEQDITLKLTELKDAAAARYSHYYHGQALENKISEAVDESTVGIILNKNLQKLQQGGKTAVQVRGVVTAFLVVVLIPAMIGGIIATQMLAYADLSTALSWTLGFADYLSWGICTIAGVTYTPVIVGGGSRCLVELGYGVEKVADGNVTSVKKAIFQWVRGWNSTMNLGEGIVGYILKKAESIADFAHEAGKVVGNAWDLSFGAFLTGAAGLCSFLTNSIQGKETTYEETRDQTFQNYKTTELALQECRSSESVLIKTDAAPIVHDWRRRQVEHLIVQSKEVYTTASFKAFLL